MLKSNISIKHLKTEQDFLDIKPLFDGLNLYKAFNKVLVTMPYYDKHLRHTVESKNKAVLITMKCFAYNEPLPDSSWENSNRQWISTKMKDKSIILAEKRVNNTNIAHFYIVLIPIVQDGSISYGQYFDGKAKLIKFQSEYAALMSSLYGMQKMVIPKINDVKSLPLPVENESAVDYYNRITGQSLTAPKPSSKDIAGYKHDISELRKQVRDLKKCLSSYIDMLQKYGGLAMVNNYIITARNFKSAIKMFQAEHNTDEINHALSIMDKGREYQKDHPLK